jgi:peptidyl-prolyl cis-trans isomerase D
MLQQMRDYTKTWLSWLFVIPLVVSFAAWGINDVFRASVPDTVATVGPSTISKQEFERQYRAQVRRLSAELRQPVTPDMARSMNIGPVLLDSAVNGLALANVASNLGLGVSDAEISQQIKADRNFAGPLGTFDRDKFERDLSEQGLNEAMFFSEAHRVLAEQQLTVPLRAALGVPPGYAGALLASSREERAVDYLVISPTSLGPIAAPSDAILASYVKAHTAEFSTPEFRDVGVAFIGPEDVMNQVSVTPEQIKQLYDANSATYNVPEKRNLEQLIFASEADARAARAKLDAGQTFDQVATSLGKKPADISIGTVVQQDLPDARGQVAFSLPANGVSAPVKGPFGWVMLHVTAITPGKVTPLEQATPDIRQAVLKQEAAAKVADIMNACQDALGTGAEIQEAATRSAMHFVHVPATDRSGLSPDGTHSAAPDNDDLRAEIFKAEVGDIGDPFQTKDGHAFAIKVNGVTPPKLKSLDAVRAQAVAQWSAEQRAAQLRTKAQTLADQANAVQDLTPTARSVGARVESGPALMRTTQSDTFSKPLVGAIFAAKFGSVVIGPLGKGDGYVIARVTGIRHKPSAPGNQDFEMNRSELGRQIGDDLALSLAQTAKARQGVTIHPDLVQSVTGGEGS